MIHPPTFTHGPLHDHELAELADLLDDIDTWIADDQAVPGHLRIRIPPGRHVWPTSRRHSGEGPRAAAAARRADRPAAAHAPALPARRCTRGHRHRQSTTLGPRRGTTGAARPRGRWTRPRHRGYPPKSSRTARGQDLRDLERAQVLHPAPTQAALRSLEWVGRAENLAICGPSGTGKSHFCEAIAHAVIDAGMRVSWFSLETLTATMARAKVDASINRVVTKICRAELIVIDDIGMLPAGQDAAEAFYRVIDAAYERRSVAVTSNIHPSGFDTIMPKSIATAAVDRLLHHAHLVATEGPSVRLEEALAGAGVMALSTRP